MTKGITNADVTATIKTFMRPDKFEKCLRAVINAGVKKVIVGFDGPEKHWPAHKKIYDFYNDVIDIQLTKLPYNAGLSKVRNMTLDMVDTDFLLQLDDDNYIPSNVLDIVPFLKNMNKIGAVALGWVFPSGFLQFDAYDVEIINNYLVRTFKAGKTVQYYGGLTFLYPYDFIPNCALFKKAIFDDVRWDEKFIISGEHEDFYLNMLKRDWIFAICPSVYAYHDWGGQPEFENHRRGIENQKSYDYLMNKWNLKGIMPQRHLSMYLEHFQWFNWMMDKHRIIKRKVMNGEAIHKEETIKF